MDSMKFIFSMVIYYNYDNAFELSTSAQHHYKGDFTMNENTNVQIITLFPLADNMPPQLINNVSVTAKICRERTSV